MLLKENSTASVYYDLLSNLNESSKIELIAHLSNSIINKKQQTTKPLEDLFGAWKSKETAEEIIAEIKTELSRSNVTPGLALVLVGNNPASEIYVKMKEKKLMIILTR